MTGLGITGMTGLWITGIIGFIYTGIIGFVYTGTCFLGAYPTWPGKPCAIAKQHTTNAIAVFIFSEKQLMI